MVSPHLRASIVSIIIFAMTDQNTMPQDGEAQVPPVMPPMGDAPVAPVVEPAPAMAPEGDAPAAVEPAA